MAGGRHQLVEHARVGGRVISGDLNRGRPVFQGVGEESPGGRQVALLADQHVDDLPELVDGPIQINPPSSDLGGKSHRRTNDHLTHVDTVVLRRSTTVRSACTTVHSAGTNGPPHDHIRWEAKASEARPRCGHPGTATMHQASLPARGDAPTQLCP